MNLKDHKEIIIEALQDYAAWFEGAETEDDKDKLIEIGKAIAFVTVEASKCQ